MKDSKKSSASNIPENVRKKRRSWSTADHLFFIHFWFASKSQFSSYHPRTLFWPFSLISLLRGHPQIKWNLILVAFGGFQSSLVIFFSANRSSELKTDFRLRKPRSGLFQQFSTFSANYDKTITPNETPTWSQSFEFELDNTYRFHILDLRSSSAILY